jgi:hypothetical protein
MGQRLRMAVARPFARIESALAHAAQCVFTADGSSLQLDKAILRASSTGQGALPATRQVL